jgi:hypothetical protein
MLRIEFEEPGYHVCDCCGGTTTRLTRFVYRDEDAHAIYYASFSAAHPERPARMLVSLGEWGDGSVPEQRRAFVMDVRSTSEQYEVMVTDGSTSPWAQAKVIGKLLEREEALADPWLPEAFHITDHAVLEDEELRSFLESTVD